MGLLDRIVSWGRAALATPPPPPSTQTTKRIATPGPWIDRDPAMLGNSLTPEKLTRLIFERNYGYLQSWADLAHEAREKDPHLHSQLAIREQSVVETEFEVLPGPGSNQKAAKRAAAAWEARLREWQQRARAQTSDEAASGWDTWVAELAGSIYLPARVHEVLWERDGREVAPVALEQLEDRRLSYASDPSDPEPWALRLWDQQDPSTPFGQTYGVRFRDLHPDKFLVSRTHIRHAQPSREGLFAILVWFWLFGVWDWRDLIAMVEQLGRPPIVAYYAAGGAKADGALAKMNGERAATKEEVAAAKKAIQSVSGALRAILADTVRLQPLEMKFPGDQPPQMYVMQAVQALESKAINGVANLSDLQPGARAAVETQERISNTFWRSDCRRVARQLSWLGARYIQANPGVFTDGCPTPLVRFKTDPPRDLKSAMDRIEKARANGIKVPRKWAHQEVQIPEPEVQKDGTTEPVLDAPIAPPPVPLPPGAQDTPKGEPPTTDTPNDPPAKE